MSDARGEMDLSGDRGFQDVRESVYHVVLLACAVVSVLTTIGIVYSLAAPSVAFFAEVSAAEFFTATEFNVNIQPVTFGVLPLAFGTIIVTVGAAAVALPLGLLTAIYLSEYADSRTRAVLKPMLEVLAGIPTVVYGYFALVYVTPFLDGVLPVELNTFNVLSASLVMGVMIVPMVSSISEDSMSAVPDTLRQGAYGLGATKYEVSTRVVVPAAVSGIASSYILAVSRAIGETMIVVVAAGNLPNFPSGPGDVLTTFFEQTQTMTAAMVEVLTSEIGGGTVAYRSVFAIGLTLFGMTFALNLVSDFVAERYREEYD
ncbi:phosphate ABC transporter permease subunit PstC [Halobacteriales archaeon SW_7_71_33]|nr:MAG: phosphate ABC transporter permease subunit PstC [Halobacteriales archaeon SW_7_71_33]